MIISHLLVDSKSTSDSTKQPKNLFLETENALNKWSTKSKVQSAVE